MSKENGLDYISNILSDVGESLETAKKRVRHGRPRIQRKKIKSQVLKGHTPRDYDRENICKNARKKAHSAVANSKRRISNTVRQGLHEGLPLMNPKALTLSEAYEFDFIEEATGYDIEFTWFDKPQVTSITEGLDVGITKTGRKRKCKAIGIAEGCFAPIMDADGERIFSRNNRLYAPDHWSYQITERHLGERVASRGMLGTIGHHDKRVDDVDLAEGKVSHIITHLEIREDDNGTYLWGRFEIINTPAGRLLKEYYENDIPLYVSSRGGGKLLEVAGQTYKLVDKKRYFCECFDVVKEPGFLGACPNYFSIIEDEDEENYEENDTSEIEEAKLLTATPEEGLITIKEEEDNMSKVNCKVTADDNMKELVDKVITPMSEKLAELTNVVKAISDQVFESEEAPAEEAEAPAAEETKEEPAGEAQAEQAPAEEIKEEAEAPAEEPQAAEAPVEEQPEAEEKPAEEIKEEAPAEEAEAPAAEETKEEPAGEAQAEEPKAEEAPVQEATEEPQAAEAPVEEQPEAEEKPAEGDAVQEGKDNKKCEKCGKENCECGKEDKKEDKKDKVDEQWAHEDPKETAPETKDIHAPKGLPTKPETPFKGDVYAHEDPGSEAGSTIPVKATVDGKDGEQEAKKVADAVIKEEAEAPIEEQPQAEAGMEQVVDYKSMYEAKEAEQDEAIKTIDEMIATFKDFGKRYHEVVAESKKIQEQLDTANKTLNSYKLVDKFNITVEKANELLSSKSYEAVEEELKAEEAKKAEEEAQAKVEEVSESIAENPIIEKAPVSRKTTYSVFSAQPKEEISESSEEKTSKGRRFSWFRG